MNLKNSITLYYTIDKTTFTTNLVIPGYNWEKDNPNDWVDQAKAIVNNFICTYTDKAGFRIINKFQWCFSYIDLKYIGTPEYSRKIEVELTK